jgi:hypothetical protein
MRKTTRVVKSRRVEKGIVTSMKLVQRANTNDALSKLDVMYDARTLLRKHLEETEEFEDKPARARAAATYKRLKDPVIVERSVLHNLAADIDVFKSNQSMNAEIQRGFDVMKADADEIALFLRDQFSSEIDQGFHQGRTLGVIVVGYLKKFIELRARGRN